MIPHFSTLGSGSTTVLMLHGAEGSHLCFAPQLETLAAAGYRAVAWDMPGYGSSAPIEPYNFKGLAAQCIALIEALRCPQVVLLGHGMGAALALEVALRKPQLISRLVLVNPLCMHTPEMIALIASIISAFSDDPATSMSTHAEKQIATRVGTGHLPEGLRLLMHAFGQVPPGTYRRALEALQLFDRKAALELITCPALLITGEQDTLATPQQTAALAGLLGKGISSDTHTLTGIGHYANLEAPDEFDGALLNWLAMSAALQRVLH